MFASDAAGYKTGPGEISPVFFQDYDSYIATLNRFQSLPIRILAMAHGDVFKGDEVKQYLEETVKAAEEGFAFIKAALEAGEDDDEVGKKVFERYFKGGMAYYPPDIMYSTMKLLVLNVKSKL